MLNESKKWCNFNPKYKYDDDAMFHRIIEFFLWQCPTPKTAYGSKLFSDYGWEKPYQFKTLKKKCGLGDGINYITPNRGEFYEELIAHGQFNSFKFSEIVIILNSNQSMFDLFRNIRNAFAHGSFLVRKHCTDKEFYYFLESRNPENEHINARLVLKASTLFNWIKVVKKGP